jgi:hypothetical protein
MAPRGLEPSALVAFAMHLVVGSLSGGAVLLAALGLLAQRRRPSAEG